MLPIKAPIEVRIKALRELNKKHSRLFCSPDAQNSRKLYRVEHPTAIFNFACMDGRVHIPLVTGTPLGIMRSFRNIGGIFDLGWHYLDVEVSESIEYAISTGRRVLILVTYHYSKGDNHRGCAGCDYDNARALQVALDFKRQIERVYGNGHQVVCPVLLGLETDDEALIVHGDDYNERFNLSVLTPYQKDQMPFIIRGIIQEHYPEMVPLSRELIVTVNLDTREMKKIR